MPRRLHLEAFRSLAGEVLGVAVEQLLGGVREEVDLLTDAAGFAGLKATDPRVAVEADVDAFEEFEGAVAGDGEQGRTIGGNSPDDPVGDAIQGDGAGVGVAFLDPVGKEDLAAEIGALVVRRRASRGVRPDRVKTKLRAV